MFDSDMSMVDSFLVMITLLCIYSYTVMLFKALLLKPNQLMGFIHTLRTGGELNQKRMAMLGSLGVLVGWMFLTHKNLHFLIYWLFAMLLWLACVIMLIYLKQVARQYMNSGIQLITFGEFRRIVVAYSRCGAGSCYDNTHLSSQPPNRPKLRTT